MRRNAIGTAALGGLAALALATAVPAAAAPVSVRPPVLGYTVEALAPGADIVASTGVWRSPEGVPLYYLVRWEACRGATGCQPLPGSISSVYRIGITDVGARLRVVVTAWGVFGSATATSSLTPVVTATARVPKLRVIPARRRYVVRNSRLAVSGRVSVGPVARGKLVQLQWLDGRTWKLITQSRINDRGFFVLRYAFARGGGYSLRMRVLVPTDPGWAYPATASPTFTVRVDRPRV